MDKLSIVVTAYSPKSKRYLDYCIQSIRNLNYDQDKIEVIIVGRKSYLPSYSNCFSVHPDQDEFPPGIGINCGIMHTSKESKFILLCNDDVVLTKDSVKNMIAAAGDNEVILNPMESPAYRFGENERLDIENMINTQSTYAPDLIAVNELCLFASLFPRKVLDKIGEWDTANITWNDDVDYSWRAKEKGVGLFICPSALVWHARGATTSDSLSAEVRKDADRRFYAKWKKLPPGKTIESLK